MYPYYYRLLHGMPSPSLSSLTLSGYSEAPSNPSARHPDTERPELAHFEFADGTIRMGEPDGKADAWIESDRKVPMEHAR